MMKALPRDSLVWAGLCCGDSDSQSLLSKDESLSEFLDIDRLLLSKDEPLPDFPDLGRLLLLPPCSSGRGGGAVP